jgi:hypothetical protein
MYEHIAIGLAFLVLALAGGAGDAPATSAADTPARAGLAAASP